MNRLVDFYLGKTPQWREELDKLREIILACGLNEEIKWGVPCYTSDKRNIVLLGRFKEFCALLFVKGALLKDAQSILTAVGENTQSGRRIKFTDVETIAKLEPHLKAYIHEAVKVEKAGLKVEMIKNTERELVAELQATLAADAKLKQAFEALTPGRQRAYNMHFSAPKQAKTREARIDKCTPDILAGKGFADDYKAKKIKG